MSIEHVDVLIVGAGLSGVGAAHELQSKCPSKRILLLEARDCIGGTWDLFRYGCRSFKTPEQRPNCDRIVMNIGVVPPHVVGV